MKKLTSGQWAQVLQYYKTRHYAKFITEDVLQWVSRSDIKDIQINNGFMLFLLENGELYAVGDSKIEPMGISEDRVIIYPEKIMGNIKQISCGPFSTHLVDTDGNLYGFGMDLYYIDKYKWGRSYDIQQLGSNKYIQVSTGYNFVAILDKDHTIHLAGRNLHYQLHTKDKSIVYHTHKILDTPVKQITTGLEHILVLGEDGVVYGWGDNTFGQLAADTEQVSIETIVDFTKNKIEKILAIRNQSYALDETGTLYMCGFDDDLETKIVKPQIIETNILGEKLKKVEDIYKIGFVVFAIVNGNIEFITE